MARSMRPRAVQDPTSFARLVKELLWALLAGGRIIVAPPAIAEDQIVRLPAMDARSARCGRSRPLFARGLDPSRRGYGDPAGTPRSFGRGGRHGRCTAEAHPRKDPMMTTLDLDTLTQVTGGVTRSSSSSSAALTQSLATIQSSISNLTNNSSNNQNNMLLPMAMMMAMNRRQSSVISAGGATVVS